MNKTKINSHCSLLLTRSLHAIMNRLTLVKEYFKGLLSFIESDFRPIFEQFEK